MLLGMQKLKSFLSNARQKLSTDSEDFLTKDYHCTSNRREHREIKERETGPLFVGASTFSIIDYYLVSTYSSCFAAGTDR